MRPGFAALALLAAAAGAAPLAAQQPPKPPTIPEHEAAARADSNDAANLYNLALAYWPHRRWAKVDSLLRLAVKVEPRFAEGYLALHFLAFSRRPSLAREQARGRVPEEWQPRLDEANRFYRLAFRTNPLVKLGVLGVAYEVSDPHTADMSVRVLREYELHVAWFVDLGLGRYADAHDRLSRLARVEFDEERKPHNVPDGLLWYRGLAGAHSLRYNDAIRDFRTLFDRSLREERNDSLIHIPLRTNEFRFMLAALYHVSGQLDTAMTLYQESLGQDLGLVTAHTYLAGIYEARNQPDSALLERRRGAEGSPDDPVALFDYAATLARVGRLAEAEPFARQAMELNDRFAAPHYLLARIADAANRHAEARQQYEQFLARAPKRFTSQIEYATTRLAALPKEP